jgi:diadenosine tetraphosphate (Ap4A) HIT family hydrolase
LTSPFLNIPEQEWLGSNSLAFAIWDGYPVAPGHALIVPRRLISSWWDTTVAEQSAILEMIGEAKEIILAAGWKPDGWNIGMNLGEAAGQTVFHLHVHLIPRYRGDMADPRGGVRHVIPERGNYKISHFF